MTKYEMFLSLAEALNRELGITPLLFGSLGLEQRLQMELQADDIDILLPEVWLRSQWNTLVRWMTEQGYKLYDLHEHAFCKDHVSTAFASLESLGDFAGIEIAKIPILRYNNTCYMLLELEDYRKVYAASSLDGYRKDKKNKDDSAKVALIDRVLRKSF